MSNPNTSDFLIIGGGLAGSVIASRLAESRPKATITVLEAGNDETSNPLTASPLACFGAHFSPLDWVYWTVPQKHLDNKPRYAAAGKALGGSSAVNYGTWTRGPKSDGCCLTSRRPSATSVAAAKISTASTGPLRQPPLAQAHRLANTVCVNRSKKPGKQLECT